MVYFIRMQQARSSGMIYRMRASLDTCQPQLLAQHRIVETSRKATSMTAHYLYDYIVGDHDVDYRHRFLD